MKTKQKYYLVGNAHLDPVWQWRWQEGSAEAKATVRSALDRMKEFPDFRFVCSSASVYRWVEEFAPEMFAEIRQRVTEGRWIVVGGWEVQPDCNMPAGEGFARQALYSQRYFREKLGVTAKVGYNVDSFGHNANMPQLLAQSGLDCYIFQRPGPHEKTMQSDLFLWTAPDGSAVTAYRILEPYCSNFTTPEELEARVTHLNEKTATDIAAMPLFYGVGNHGGGPTVRNLQLLEAYRAAHPEKELIYSDISDFFAEVKANKTPVPTYTGELQHHASGCYSTVYAIKNGVRRAETELIAAERFGMLARALCGKQTREQKFADAWRNVCFCHFHDSLCGCSIREVYDDAALMLGEARQIAAVAENNALQMVSWQINTADRTKGLPVVVFNPNGFEVCQAVQVNRQAKTVTDAKGNRVMSQLVHSTTHECTWRDDTLFEARVPALGYAVYYLREEESEPTETAVSAKAWAGVHTANEHGGTVLENEYYAIRFEEYSGYITSFVDKRTGRECITDRAAVPVVINEYEHDTWSHGKNVFSDAMARFSDATVTVSENGPMRATVKVISRYGQSTLTQYFSLSQGSEKLTVRAEVDWHEKYKMLKLRFPMAVEKANAYYEIPFGIIERPTNGEEEPGLMWNALKGRNGGWAWLNDSIYSASAAESTMNLTLLRSTVYGDHGGPRTEESEFSDQGLMRFRYTMMPLGADWSSVIREAAVLNKPLTNIVETWHEGVLPEVCNTLQISASNVILSALKRSEDGKGTVIRLYETDGKPTEVTVSGQTMPHPLTATVPAWAVRTFCLTDGAADWQEVLFTEYPAEPKA